MDEIRDLPLQVRNKLCLSFDVALVGFQLLNRKWVKIWEEANSGCDKATKEALTTTQTRLGRDVMRRPCVAFIG